MKLDTMGSTPRGVSFTNALVLFSFLASVLASPILTTRGPNCKLSTCELGRQCFKAGSCFGINLFDPDWSHCKICACPSQAFGGRTDPQCVMDIECLNVQLGNRPDPCAKKASEAVPEIASREVGPQTGDDGTIDPFSAKPNIKAPANITALNDILNYLKNLPEGSSIDPEVLKKLSEALQAANLSGRTAIDLFSANPNIKARTDIAALNEILNYLKNLPEGSSIDPEVLKRLREALKAANLTGRADIDPFSANRNIKARTDIGEFIEIIKYINSLPEGASIDPEVLKRLSDGVPGSNILNGRTDIDPEVLDKLRQSLPPTHVLNERTVTPELMEEFARLIDDGPNGPITPDAAMMERLRPITHPGDFEDTIDIEVPVSVDLKKRGGCYTVENGAIVEKRGGCGNINDDIDVDIPVNVNLKTRGGCYTVDNGVVVEKRGGCGNIEDAIDADIAVDVGLKKRGDCYTVENGVVVEKRGGCDGKLEE
ncbi:hypothetical protein V492_03402 [Pseudogymnoascus sp. VKM F-4246]|nr:hypothetical protein V492_03402 [Pseudogymnoascus sp. VKM F-4246]